MEILQTKVDDIDVFALHGKLDVTGSQKASDAILPAIPKGGKLILDMTECDYVASSGLRVLLITAKQSAAGGCKTVLAGVRDLVWDVIVMTGFEDVLPAYPTKDDALAALK